MSVRVCVYPVPLRDPGSLSRYGSASSSIVSGPVSPSPLISASTMAALSRQAVDMSASTNQRPDAVVSTPTQSRICSLPEIPNSPSARSVTSSDSPFLIQVRNITEKQNQQTSVKSSQHCTARNSTFPNFRALQRLSLSAKTKAASPNKNPRRSSTTYDYFNPDLNQNSTSSKSSSSRTPLLYRADDQTQRSGQDLRKDQSLDDRGTPAAFSALESLPGNRHSDTERRQCLSSEETIQGYVADHSVSPKFHKKKSAKKKKRKTKRTKSRAHHLQKHPQDSRRSSSDKTAPLQDNSLGAILRAMPVMVETKKIEVYSSRYSKCDTERIVSHQNEKKSLGDERGDIPKYTNSPYRDSPQGALLMSKVSLEGPDPVIYASRVSPRIPGPSGPGGGSRDQGNMSRVTRVYLSEKQSGNLRECGLILPCAPPGTPTPQMLQRYQYIPSMMDLRSQRAVRDRLSGMEQKAKKKQQQQREEARKTEQQLQRDQAVAWKQRQRREIYALNKIMTEFEAKNFQEFMKRMSEKTP
ncbi:uncharacterized protein LOC119732246 [Patiria miniata]|uniref:Small vasohibin-binding protein n=1 Tax=Patiria miniata TaxID=46514 RepID=A0A914ACZ4_PATMI|nr:uncharacterized protein LOC119732246 [Patiria miniata]